MSQHTPGPWFVLVTPAKRRIILAHDPEMPESPWNIAEVALEAGYGDYDPVDDNARLIAAAPELLEALRDLVLLAGSAMRLANNDGAEYRIDDELRDARAAIAKAEGGGK